MAIAGWDMVWGSAVKGKLDEAGSFLCNPF